MNKTRILIADDHMLMRMGISALVTSTKDMEIVGDSEATKAIHDAHPEIKIVILTTFGTSVELAKAVTNGAVGILLKDKVDMDLVNTIRFVVEGNQVIPTRLLEQIEQDKALSNLTDRQLEVLASVAQGQSNSDIAKQFGLSEITIKKHLSAIFERLGVANRSEAVALALRKQMLKT